MFQATCIDGSELSIPHVFHNPASGYHQSNGSKADLPPDAATRKQILALQSQLPQYGQTPLIAMPELAQEYRQSNVFIKDESNRFGLTSFKILGASWSIYRILCESCDFLANESPTLDALRARLNERSHEGRGLALVTCSAGNWGRACARMAAVLGVRATILLPRETETATRDLIGGEGPTVEARIVDVSYDAAVDMVKAMGEREGNVLVMDTSWEGFTKVPAWVVEGYSTMLDEVEVQVREACGKRISTVVVSVGVGSWAQAVVERYKAEVDEDESRKAVRVVTVEPSRAACLMVSLYAGKVTAISTKRTIMNGMNCGVVSDIAWPSLSRGVDVSVAVDDVDVHGQTLKLARLGHSIGPCGAATVVALGKLWEEQVLEADPEGVVVLFSTEGSRTYDLVI